ncbi:MAG: MucR family transcriptional regulator [Magnetococcales bacterium]|nr:MucR family transcriptional regulator [Magnetococcales bacterium]
MTADLLKFASEIVEAYVAKNELSPREVPVLLREVFDTLRALSEETDAIPTGEPPPDWTLTSFPESTQQRPFVPLDQAVTPQAIICLICGRACKALRAHLTRTHGMEVPQYRAMFGLDRNFPMTAPEYSGTRRKLAKQFGLGGQRLTPEPPENE